MTIPQSHRPGPWYGHWRPRSKKWFKKPVCETVVWPLTLKKPGSGDQGMVTARPGQKPERRHPSPIKTFSYWWTTHAGIRIVAFRIAANTMERTGRKRIQVFFLNVNFRCTPTSKKKTKFDPFCFTLSYLQWSLRQQFADVRHLSIRGSFDGWRTTAFRFLTQFASDLVKN